MRRVKRNIFSPFNLYNKIWKIFADDRSATMGKAFRRACSECLDDVKWIKDGGGKILRDATPQLSLADFEMTDNLDDWFLTTDKKNQIEDRSEAQAWVENGALIFSGFLHHSSPELAHNQRHPDARGVGYANLHTKMFNPILDLSNYWSIGMKFRSDGRCYFLLLKLILVPECPSISTVYCGYPQHLKVNGII
eukprot:UN29814